MAPLIVKPPSPPPILRELHPLGKVNRLVIDLATLRANMTKIRMHLPSPTRIMAMVKANAYGTSPITLGKFYHTLGIDILGVAHADEAITLRKAGVKQALFVISTPHYDIEKCVCGDFEMAVSDYQHCVLINNAAKAINKTIKVHLHIDTGMGRFGVRAEHAVTLAQQLKNLSHIALEGIMTHFACADDEAQDVFTKQQIDTFKNVVHTLHQEGIDPPWIHAANSPGTLRFSIPFCNMVRLGAAPLGFGCPKAIKQKIGLKETLSLTSRIASINVCKQGESVSYGRHYQVQKTEEKIGVIPLGYYDGLHRCYSGKGYVLIANQKAPMVGTICMDFMMVNLSNVPRVGVGDLVTIFGKDLSAKTVAKWGNTHVNEFITCLGPRIQRIFKDDPK